MTDTTFNLEQEIESAMNAAWPDMTRHDRKVVREDIAALCRVLREQHDLLRPLIALKRALERNGYSGLHPCGADGHGQHRV